MKLFLAIISVILVSCHALLASAQGGAARTISSDTVASDTVWSGRVVVERPLTVLKQATLTIKPGTAVSFRKGAGLAVEGVLKAVGQKGSPVSFTSDEKTPAPGDWAGISLTESGEGTALTRCVISFAAAGLSMAVCAAPVTGCEISKGVKGIVLARKARPRLDGNTVREMSAGGIECQMGSAPLLTANRVEGCGPFGIGASQDSQPVIKGNTVSGCDTGIALSKSSLPVEGNVIKGNKVGIMASSVGPDLVVRGNRITGNDTGIVCQQFAAPLIEKNDISGNGREGIVCFRASSPTIRGNNIYGNKQGITCVQICSPSISANNIYDNKKGIYLDLSSYAVIHGNNIYDNETQVELGNMSSDWEYRVNQKPERGMQAQVSALASRGKAPYRQVGDNAHIMGFVDATGNWWGAAVTEEMEAKGPEANIKSFIDYYDVPTRAYEGYSGIYVQDKIKYEGWKRSRIMDAGF